MTLLAGAMLCCGSAMAAADPLFDGDGYRIAHYRGPVSQPPDGVGRIAPSAAARLRPDRDAIFVDVAPAEGAIRDGRQWRLAAPHRSIPHSHWFPEAGRAPLSPEVAGWFENGVARLAGGDKRRMIIVYCFADCWMSWNAAKRLRALGYSNIWWLAEGSDGWRDLGLPLLTVQPER
ncbi:rhodanese [Sphingomonas sp. Root710]|uniref:rhodanese-like domain-containing protein n=1 Tax=Sphingomonas sp. Root710 TaxID=1736594 RepID=UPI0006F6F3AB|nr:rhodanese-like domain-containing protein [Sphingomonas sp. Root710]KRB86769.1 rhodanese [Sphingomonas sp. Root710]